MMALDFDVDTYQETVILGRDAPILVVPEGPWRHGEQRRAEPFRLKRKPVSAADRRCFQNRGRPVIFGTSQLRLKTTKT
jgi:hypothetical protein